LESLTRLAPGGAFCVLRAEHQSSHIGAAPSSFESPTSHLTERYLVEGELMATFCADTIGPVLEGNGPKALVDRMTTSEQGEKQILQHQ
jgi:hypothetical protein